MIQEKVPVGIAVFVWRDGKFIFMQRTSKHGEGTWSVPGGHLEPGETFEECAQREVMEEVGSTIGDIKLLAVTNDIFATGKHYVSLWMIAKWEANEPESQEPDKVAHVKWLPITELPDNLFEPCWTNLRQAVPDFFVNPGKFI